MARRNPFLVIALVGMFSLPFACGGRNLNAFLLTDDLEDVGSGGEGGGEGGQGGEVGVGGVGGEGGRPGPGPGPGQGPGPSTGPGGIQDCFGCAASSCPEAVACFTDTTCRDGLICGATQCLGGGSPDLMCFLDCFDGDAGAAYQAFQAFQCIMQDCADECGGLLGGGFPGGP